MSRSDYTLPVPFTRTELEGSGRLREETEFTSGGGGAEIFVRGGENFEVAPPAGGVKFSEAPPAGGEKF